MHARNGIHRNSRTCCLRGLPRTAPRVQLTSFSVTMKCALAALDLSKKQPEFAAKGVNLVGVVHEKLGVEEFSGFFKNGEIYFDEQKAFFNGEGKLFEDRQRFLRCTRTLIIDYGVPK